MITINLSEEPPIDFGATGTGELIQNIRMISSTMQGTVPLARGFGIDPTTLDRPIPIAKALLAAQIIAAVRQYEPRVNVEEVAFEEDHETGSLVPIVRISEVTT